MMVLAQEDLKLEGLAPLHDLHLQMKPWSCLGLFILSKTSTLNLSRDIWKNVLKPWRIRLTTWSLKLIVNLLKFIKGLMLLLFNLIRFKNKLIRRRITFAEYVFLLILFDFDWCIVWIFVFAVGYFVLLTLDYWLAFLLDILLNSNLSWLCLWMMFL